MKRIFLATGLILISLGLFANGADDGAAAEEVTPIEFMARFYSGVPCPDDHPVKLEMEKRAGVSVNIQWVSANNYEDKVHVNIAANEMPDLFHIWYGDPVYQDAAKQGAFWDSTDYIPQYPNMSQIPQVAIESLRINGRNYGIPLNMGKSLGSEVMPVFRNDWLENLGLDVPESMDDIYKVLKAFVEQDPDGNGKADTMGLTGSVAETHMGGLGWIIDAFIGSFGGWYEEDGTMKSTLWLPEQKDALLWMNKLYNEGLITPDFAIIQDSQNHENAKSGKYGVYTATIKNGWRSAIDMRSRPGMEEGWFKSVMAIESPRTGKPWAPYNHAQSDILVTPASVSEAKYKTILQFQDYAKTEDAYNLAKYGFEGEHWNRGPKGDVEVKEGLTNNDMVWRNLRKFHAFYVKYASGYDADFPDWFKDYAKQVVDYRLENYTINPAVNLISETGQEYGEEYGKKIQEMRIKVILGTEPPESWDALLEELKNDSTYMKIEEEMIASWKAKK